MDQSPSHPDRDITPVSACMLRFTAGSTGYSEARTCIPSDESAGEKGAEEEFELPSIWFCHTA